LALAWLLAAFRDERMMVADSPGIYSLVNCEATSEHEEIGSDLSPVVCACVRRCHACAALMRVC
ncbi:hypothetical protein FOZ61_000582, partial [Perkinsus olseni]